MLLGSNPNGAKPRATDEIDHVEGKNALTFSLRLACRNVIEQLLQLRRARRELVRKLEDDVGGGAEKAD